MTQTDRPDVSDPAWRPPLAPPMPSLAQRAIAPTLLVVSALGVIGVVVGIRMATRSTEAGMHPNAGQGTAIALLSAMFVLMTLLVAAIGSELLIDRDQGHHRSG